jgi:hypothetical protein
MRDIKPITIKKPVIIIDYASFEIVNKHVPFRGDLDALVAGRLSTNAVFNVTYINFTAEQQTAFQYAVDIWSALLHSDVPINLRAEMKVLGSGTLGESTIPEQKANFDNAQKISTAYVVAMAEKIAGYELNDSSEPDIKLAFNSNFAWYYGLDGSAPTDKHDFVSVVLHEIGHGLGFFGSATVTTSGLGFYNANEFGVPNVYGRNLETGTDQNIVSTFQTGTTELGDVFTSNDVHFRSFYFPGDSDRPRIYAPSTYNGGSSISHLNDNTYDGTDDALMTHAIGKGESIHDPGLAYEMFQDMGWVAMDIDFPLFFDSEDSLSDRTLVATIKGDSAVLAGGVDLHYSFAEFAGDTIVNMTPTGNANEYSAIIEASGNEEEVSYYINVAATGGKVFTSPGEAPNFFWQFVMAKDTIAPLLDHKPVSTAFLSNPVVLLSARVTDNIGVGDLMLTYKVNSGPTSTTTIPLTNSTTNGLFEGEYILDWDLTPLGIKEGDTVKYQLEIQDVASNPNLTNSPETGFYNIQIFDFNEPVALYENNFNTPTTDFAGAGFVIGAESGFDSDAIHSDHPYRVVDGSGAEDTLTLIYLLKTPIIISETNATMNFDEVVLVEPGTAGTKFGDDEFWDYVVVEGSNDFGLTWTPLADGYDSREHNVWLTRYNSDTDGQNSNALGDKDLYIKNEIDLVNRDIIAGDTVLIRFRMFIDPFAHGWGWAIDNLQIQIDTEPPVVTQITPDYMMVGDTQLTLKSKVEDNVELDSVIYEVDFNGVAQLTSFPGTTSQFSLDLNFPALTATDVLKYRIIAVDKALIPNTTIFPLTGFFEVPVAVLGTARDMYVNDFNTVTDDFIGVNFSIRTPDKFTDPALVSTDPYPDAPFDNSEMYYLLKYPITLNTTAALVQYEEVVLVEPTNDQVAFEVSKDGGATWIAVFDPYDASAESAWASVFNNFDADGNSTGNSSTSLLKRRLFNILDNAELNGGEEVLVRFRMTVNDKVHGEGWIVDNLEIQGPTTAIEDELTSSIQIYPNPTNTGSVVISGTLSGRTSRIVVTDVLGKIVLSQEAPILNNTLQTTLSLTNVKKGLYLISVSDNSGIYTSRIIIE